MISRDGTAVESLTLARQPLGNSWQRHPDWNHCRVYSHHRSGARVLSTVEMVQGEDGRVTKEWHVSVSMMPVSRLLLDSKPVIADNLVMAMVRRDFGMEDAFEDNHQPGAVRNLWLCVDPNERRPQCECVDKEQPHEQGPRIWRDAPESHSKT